MKIDRFQLREAFIKAIGPKKLYKFSSNKLTTNIPHFFVCITTTQNEIVVFTCCTSQLEKRQSYIERYNLPYSTLVWIKAPNNLNELYKDTYVDCNKNFNYSYNDLRALYDNGTITYEGDIEEAEWLQIIQGLLDSPRIDELVKDGIRPLLHL
ncbi:MAG: hypothetical protein ACRBFS_12935 [Aureispira sp.]